MKLLHPKEPRPTRVRAQDVVMPESEPSPESPIPWEAIAQRFKPQFVELIDQANTHYEVPNVGFILLLFPELRERLQYSEEHFIQITTRAHYNDNMFLPGLIEIFPGHRQQMREAMPKAFRYIERELQGAANSLPLDYNYLLLQLSYVPEYFNQYKDSLPKDRSILLEKLRTTKFEGEILGQMAIVVLFFPDLRQEIQKMVVEFQVKIMRSFDKWMKDPDDHDKPDSYNLMRGLVHLKIIYAESAGYGEDGSIFIEEKKRVVPTAPPLPARDLAA